MSRVFSAFDIFAVISYTISMKQRDPDSSSFFRPVGRLELDLAYIQRRMRRLGMVHWVELARELGMFPPQLHYLLSTRRCRLQTAEKLCRILKSDLSDIMVWRTGLQSRPEAVTEVAT